MENNTIETLLLRHYGYTAPVPADLEQRLSTSLRQSHREEQQRLQVVDALRQQRVSRRQAVRIFAIGAAGLGLLSAGLEGLQMVEAALAGQDVNKPAYS